MAGRMTPWIKRLLEERKLLKIEPDMELVLKEMEGSNLRRSK